MAEVIENEPLALWDWSSFSPRVQHKMNLIDPQVVLAFGLLALFPRLLFHFKPIETSLVKVTLELKGR